MKTFSYKLLMTSLNIPPFWKYFNSKEFFYVEPLNRNMRERTRQGVIYYEELDHVVMEAEKTQELQSAVWRCKRANGIIPAQV